MWSLDQGNKDLESYFKIIEEEAKELRESNTHTQKAPSFKVDYDESSNHHDGDGYGSSNHGSSSNNYGGGGARNHGSNSNNNYGGGNSNGTNFNSYGGSDNNWGASLNNYGRGGGFNDERSNGERNKFDFAAKNEANFGAKPISNYNPESDPATIFYGNYSQNCVYQNNNGVAQGNPGCDLHQQPNGASDLNQASISGHYSNEQRVEADAIATPFEDSQNAGAYLTGDPDGYKRIDFNRCFISYTEPTELFIRHIFLTVFQRNDLIEYVSKILECTNQDKIVLSIQRDNTLAEAFAQQLCNHGFWSILITNKTTDPVKLANQHSVYRCIVTTMAFLRDNPDLFKRPTVVLNFDHVLNHVKFLERWINYRASNVTITKENKEVVIYEVCFQHSTTSQELKEYIQKQVPRS